MIIARLKTRRPTANQKENLQNGWNPGLKAPLPYENADGLLATYGTEDTEMG